MRAALVAQLIRVPHRPAVALKQIRGSSSAALSGTEGHSDAFPPSSAESRGRFKTLAAPLPLTHPAPSHCLRQVIRIPRTKGAAKPLTDGAQGHKCGARHSNHGLAAPLGRGQAAH